MVVLLQRFIEGRYPQKLIRRGKTVFSDCLLANKQVLTSVCNFESFWRCCDRPKDFIVKTDKDTSTEDQNPYSVTA
jgi:hypothetical protein